MRYRLDRRANPLERLEVATNKLENNSQIKVETLSVHTLTNFYWQNCCLLVNNVQ